MDDCMDGKNTQSRTLTFSGELCGLNLALCESGFVYQPWKDSSERVNTKEAGDTPIEKVGPRFQLLRTSLPGRGTKPTI